VVIKASAAGEIRQLVEALASGDEVRRESAVARLAIVGPRAVDRLVETYSDSTDTDTRIGILRALEPMRDPRVIPVARQGIARGGDEAIAGVAVLRALLDAPHAPSAAAALDTLVSTALETSAEHRVRLAAADALQDLPDPIRQRVSTALGRDSGPPAVMADAAWSDALEDKLPDDPAAFRDLLQPHLDTAPVNTLRKLIDPVRARENAAKPAAKKAAWRAVRGALHQALALRGSKIAVYDLRETIEQTQEPLPVTFLAALHAVGDASCLPGLAAAYARGARDSAWPGQVREAFRAIARRERITRRHAVMKRLAAKWPEFVSTL
jgi:hypothetical protein